MTKTCADSSLQLVASEIRSVKLFVYIIHTFLNVVLRSEFANRLTFIYFSKYGHNHNNYIHGSMGDRFSAAVIHYF